MSNPFTTSHSPFIIAGPCSIESEAQFTSVTRRLAAIAEVDMIRCGIWKPRTRPGGFQGMGVDAFPVIDSAVRRLADEGLTHLPPFCCEVATPMHVEQCLRHGIGTVWIGARTTGNPFMVDELANALRGTALAVMVKNPSSPDIKLWLGAVERLRAAGVESLAAVHRGFAQYGERTYRNAPLWELPIEFKRSCPDIPLFCDPSHITGRRDLVRHIAQTALDLHFDGLMVEVHPEPTQALTDPDQQLSPALFAQMLDQLKRRSHDENPDGLTLLRSRIDSVDGELLRLLAQRMDLARDIAAVKRQHNMAVFQPQRWNAVLSSKLEQARHLGLDEEFVKALFEKIHSESIRLQQGEI
ncbi:MAG: bifunctional 3-deoxy-7-phosphoheptulonate synthase/chorismate mutase type II [Bacteroidales bacterium]|nr:bifunctional 3-deoxy-7-phosphoheptulonate synthase/chorismate mutase type II [Bacteroidales bacterium]